MGLYGVSHLETIIQIQSTWRNHRKAPRLTHWMKGSTVEREWPTKHLGQIGSESVKISRRDLSLSSKVQNCNSIATFNRSFRSKKLSWWTIYYLLEFESDYYENLFSTWIWTIYLASFLRIHSSISFLWIFRRYVACNSWFNGQTNSRPTTRRDLCAETTANEEVNQEYDIVRKKAGERNCSSGPFYVTDSVNEINTEMEDIVERTKRNEFFQGAMTLRAQWLRHCINVTLSVKNVLLLVDGGREFTRPTVNLQCHSASNHVHIVVSGGLLLSRNWIGRVRANPFRWIVLCQEGWRCQWARSRIPTMTVVIMIEAYCCCCIGSLRLSDGPWRCGREHEETEWCSDGSRATCTSSRWVLNIEYWSTEARTVWIQSIDILERENKVRIRK